MNCEEAARFLDAYLDNELGLGKRSELEPHLSACPNCRLLLARQRKFRAFFTANAPYYRAPAELRAKLLASGKKIGDNRAKPDCSC